MKRVTVPINVDIKEESLGKLTSGGSVSPALAIASRASQVLETLAEGGVVLNCEQVAEIERNFGRSIQNAQDIVRASEPRARKKDGHRAVELTVDPAFIGPLEERAKVTGISVEDQLREVCSVAFHNNWLFGLEPRGVTHVFSPEMQAFFNSELSEGFSAQDVWEAYKEVKRGRKKNVLREAEEVTA